MVAHKVRSGQEELFSLWLGPSRRRHRHGTLMKNRDVDLSAASKGLEDLEVLPLTKPN